MSAWRGPGRGGRRQHTSTRRKNHGLLRDDTRPSTDPRDYLGREVAPETELERRAKDGDR